MTRNWANIIGYGLMTIGILLLCAALFKMEHGFIAVAIALYTSITTGIFVLKKRNDPRKPDWIDVQGPFILLRTSRTGIFDRLAKYKRFWRIYGSAGTVLVALMGLAMVWVLTTAFNIVVETQPEPTGVYAPQNILLIPGVNEYVPSTFAVWFALMLAVLIHEFGHGVMSRVEDIKVKYTGIVFAVIPVGAFVEPDEEQTKSASSKARKRVFGIGIMNNVVVGLISCIMVLGLFTMVSPAPGVHVWGVDASGPAGSAGMNPNFVITSVNGVQVNTVGEVQSILNTSSSSVVAGYYKESGPAEYTINGQSLKVTTIDMPYFMSLMKSKFAPLLLLISPVSSVMSPGSPMSIFAYSDGGIDLFVAPFSGFWFLLHVLFWMFWINIAIGLSNAIPALPFDGGYIVHEYIKPLCERVGIGKYSMFITAALTIVLGGMLIGVIILPYLFHIGG